MPRGLLALWIAQVWLLPAAAGAQVAASEPPQVVEPTPSGDQQAPASPLPSANLAEEPAGYRMLITEALLEYESQRFEEARTLFERAHALFPNARTLRGMGMASFELRDYPAAVHALEQALATPRRGLEGELRAETEVLLTRARRFVGTLKVVVTPAGAKVSIDGMPTETDAAVTLSTGVHTVQAELVGYSSAEVLVRITSGSTQSVPLTLEPAGRRAALRVGPHVAAILPRLGYADRAKGMEFAIGLWWQLQRPLALEARLGIQLDLEAEKAHYTRLPMELAGYYAPPLPTLRVFIGGGTGLVYVNQHVSTEQVDGFILQTRGYSRIEDKRIAIPLFTRVGVVLFDQRVARLVMSVDYAITLANFAEGWNEQAARVHLGVIFGRSGR